MKFAEPPIPRDQINLIPTSLNELIPQESPIRLIDELLDQLDWSAFNETYRYEKRGRPPIAPRILAAVWIWAFFRRVRSSRHLEYQLKTNVEFMWLAHGLRIDHSTLATFRRENRAALKKIHRDLVRLAKQLGIIKIAELYVDATRIQANASRSRMLTAAKATELLKIIDQQIEAYLETTESADQTDQLLDDGEQLPGPLADLHRRKEELERIAEQCREMDAIRKKQGVDPEKNPFQYPITDPDSRVLPNKEGGYAPNYTPLIAVESELGMIVSTTVFNSTNEQDYLIAMIDEVESSYAVTVETVGADAAYSTGANISELEFNRNKDFLSPHRNGDSPADNPAIREDLSEPVSEDQLDKLPRNTRGNFSRDAFVYEESSDQMRCPAGKALPRKYEETGSRGGGQQVKRTVYQSDCCEGCPLIVRCRGSEGPFQSGRRVSRDEHEEHRRQHREKMSTEEAKGRYAGRLSPGERPFAQIKQHFGMRRFQTRGQPAVESEFSLAAIAQGIQRMANVIRDRVDLRAQLKGNQ